MKKNILFCLSVLLLVVAGCKKDVESVSVIPGNLSLTVGETHPLSAVVKPDKAPQNVRWQSSDPDVATVSANGLVTAIAVGECEISVFADVQKAVCRVTVKAGGSTPGDTTGTNPSDTTGTNPSDTTGTNPGDSIPDGPGFHAGHAYVDMGCGLLWATCNIGAAEPHDYGHYFAWAEVYTKSAFDWDNLKYCNDKSGYSFSKYNQTVSGTKDTLTRLLPEDDAAHVNWGGNWRMPTQAEFDTLISRCEIKQAIHGKIAGYEFRSKVNGNEIFFPCAGSWQINEVNYLGSTCFYWSATLRSSSSNKGVAMRVDSEYKTIGSDRYLGRPIRPVCVLPE